MLISGFSFQLKQFFCDVDVIICDIMLLHLVGSTQDMLSHVEPTFWTDLSQIWLQTYYALWEVDVQFSINFHYSGFRLLGQHGLPCASNFGIKNVLLIVMHNEFTTGNECNNNCNRLKNAFYVFCQ